MEVESSQTPLNSDHKKKTRRDFLILTSAAFGTVGSIAFIRPFIQSMNPAADVLALSSVDVDLKPVKVGQSITVVWRGKPLFIRHRTPQEISEARTFTTADLPDPESDEKRVIKPEWLIVIGICTHLGCVPLGQKNTDNRGKYHGWFCPCHGSEYDTSGRIRAGPAPKNLIVPEYKFITPTSIRVG